MDLRDSERTVLDRFRDRLVTAGKTPPGYSMRREAIAWGAEAQSVTDGIDQLTERGWLETNENGDRLRLTEGGMEAVKELYAL